MSLTYIFFPVSRSVVMHGVSGGVGVRGQDAGPGGLRRGSRVVRWSHLVYEMRHGRSRQRGSDCVRTVSCRERVRRSSYVSLSVCFFVCLSICLSVPLFVYLSVFISVCLSSHLLVCLSACLSACLFDYPSYSQSNYLSGCLSACLFV